MAESVQGPGAQTPARRKGCLFWGLITLLVVGLAVGGSIGYGIWSLWREVREFSTTEPFAIQEYRPRAEGEYRRVLERIEKLRPAPPGPSDSDAARKPAGEKEEGSEPSEVVALRAEDLNALWVQHPALAELRRSGVRLRARIPGDTVELDLDWPLDGIGGLEGRRLAGTFRFRIAFEHGELIVLVREGRSPSGKVLPEGLRTLVSRVLGERLRRGLGESIHAIERVSVHDGAIRVEPARP